MLDKVLKNEDQDEDVEKEEDEGESVKGEMMMRRSEAKASIDGAKSASRYSSPSLSLLLNMVPPPLSSHPFVSSLFSL